MKPVQVRHRAFVWTVFALGAGVLAYLSAHVPDSSVLFAGRANLVLWIAMILVAALSPVPLPRGLGSATLTSALDLAAILLFGPAVACWVGVLSRLSANVAQRWNPLLPGVMRVGQAVLAIGGAGTVYVLLGGRTGEGLTLSLEQSVPLLAACATYLGIKAALGAAEAGLGGRNAGRAVRAYLGEVIPGDLVVLPIGALLAFTQTTIGPAGVALFLLPLLFARHVFNLWNETKSAHLTMVRTLMSAVDAGDPFTRGHSYRISKMCLRVGRHLGMPEGELKELEFAALLHDIGRTAIQRDILIKAGRLTEQEQMALRAHPRIGHDIIAGLKFFPQAAEIVLSHHEQPDGKGYPQGLTADEIPTASRIIMAVAAFDAMTSDRPYRRGLSPEEAFEELLEHAGGQFFPDVVEALIQLYSSGALFGEFEDDHLARYREGQEHSRAIEDYLQKQGNQLGVPEKTGVEGTGAARRRHDDVPILELPVQAAKPSPAGETIRLGGEARLVVAGKSDLGCQRNNNEDAFGVFEYDDEGHGALLVLADGMGGAAAGEVASRIAVETVSAAYGEHGAGQDPRGALGRGIEEANRAIRAQSSADAQLAGMGTTCTAAAIVGTELTLGHVGDSRAYLVARGRAEQISQDHTLAAELQRAGGTKGAPEGAGSVLTRALGGQPDVEVDLPKPWTLTEGTALVLCSDGLSNMVSAEEIGEIVSEEAPGEACETLVDLARERGGPDNITVVIARLAA